MRPGMCVSARHGHVETCIFREVYKATWLIERHGFICSVALRQKRLQPVAIAA